VVGSTEIMVISPIDTTNEGPKVPEGGKGWQPVHLRQGTMDGACGLYSLMMGLIICGVVRYDDARAFYTFKPDTNIGRLFEYFGKLGPLMKQGTNLDQMVTAVDEYCPGQIDYFGQVGKGQDLIEFIDPNIIRNHPVLLLIDVEGVGHWVLVIGRECEKRGKKHNYADF
jgi:hypothetical protein